MNHSIGFERKDHVEMAVSSATAAPMKAQLLPGPLHFDSPRDQMVHAVAVVRERLGDGDCTELAQVSEKTREVLFALFLPGKRKRPEGTKQQADDERRGKPQPAWLAEAVAGQAAASFEAFDARESAADRLRAEEEGRAYRAKVRQWARSEGRFVGSHGSLNPQLVADYETAHGGDA